MNSALIVVLVLIAFALAYRFYSQFLMKKVFELDKESGLTPSEEFNDGSDFVPTDKSILLGHHYSSIAGAAPIVGPAVAVIWGWVPALVWVVLGTIFMGAVHDFGSLVLSMKHGGKSIGQLAGKVLNPRVKHLFLILILFLVWLVIAVFALVIANLFISFPSSVIPVNFEILMALFIGFWSYKKGKSIKGPAIMAQLLLFLFIYLGVKYPVNLDLWFGEGNARMAWILFLLGYSFIASVLPVWSLLQPRDYINSHQLFIGLGALILGIFIVQPQIVAPAFNLDPQGAPFWFPFLFITIACGAVSGFHGLVSSGTTSKQVKKWTDSRFIGYGGMLGEGLLALIATLAVVTGFSNADEWHMHYGSWGEAKGLQAAIEAFVLGCSQFLSGLGLPQEISQTFISVLIISFAATSLDTATRIQRYIFSEVGESSGIKVLKNKYFSGFLAVGTAFLLMVFGPGGKGGLILWPLFGTTNQLLATLTLLVISVYLIKNNKPSKAYVIPFCILLKVTLIGLIINLTAFVDQSKYLLAGFTGLLIILELWIALEAMIFLRKKRTS